MSEESEAILALADVMASGMHRLGLADACTPQGAIELLAGEIKTGSERVSEALLEIAAAIDRNGVIGGFR